MRRSKLTLLTLLSLSCLNAALHVGCAGKPVEENDPVVLMKEAEEDIQGAHYQIAIDKLRMIKNKFPYSKQSSEAHLRIGDVHMLQENYLEAASTFETFRDLHPKHERTEYAYFKIGQAYSKDIPSTPARDLNSAQKAIDALNDFLKRYPTGKDSDEVKKMLAHAKQTIAEKELYIADFYIKEKQYNSALPRLKKITTLYSDTPAAKDIQSKIEKTQHLADQSDKKATP